ncbi:hypothetical protein HPG69_007342 [Diceros bicornis minor]|uniref:Uncharacterized protein n=1 Tax=Diceros bicornis minor TaxID=77932 RepID=A0A7J7EKT5_DICBM|nr:hypothetical protein HPG69_007342 [Diceros bicornis minor]
MEKLTESMIPAFPGRNICNVPTFMFDYSAFSTSQKVLDQLFTRDHEYLAPAVHDTVTHTITEANCVIATCLGDPSMTAQDRARWVELWIQVAEVSRGGPGRPSLPTIHCLKKTWGHFSRWVGCSPSKHHEGGPGSLHRASMSPQSAGTTWKTANPRDMD